MGDAGDAVLKKVILGKPSSSKKFRINAQHFALTYSQCGDLSKDEVLAYITEKRPVDHVVCGLEKHEDGGNHIHVYVRFTKKINVKSERFFDVDGYHPNIQAMRDPRKWYNYVTKEDKNYLENFGYDFLSPWNYKKKKTDFEAWRFDMQRRRMIEYDKDYIKFVDDGNIYKWKIKGKKRHMCIITDTSSGKTKWLNKTFKGYRVFMCNNRKYPFENYDNERIIVFDDHIPCLEVLLNCSNVYELFTPVAGDTRYTTKYWELGHERVMIMLLNDLPHYSDISSFKTRFNVIDLRTNKNERSCYGDPNN